MLVDARVVDFRCRKLRTLDSTRAMLQHPETASATVDELKEYLHSHNTEAEVNVPNEALSPDNINQHLLAAQGPKPPPYFQAQTPHDTQPSEDPPRPE